MLETRARLGWGKFELPVPFQLSRQEAGSVSGALSVFGILLGALLGLSALRLSLLKEKLLSAWKDREQPSSMFCPGHMGHATPHSWVFSLTV